MRVASLIGLVLLICVGSYFSWQWYQSWDTVLSEEPPRDAESVVFDIRKSTVQPSIRIPYLALQAAANQAADRFAVPASGRVHVDCRKIEIDLFVGKLRLYSGCLDVDWDVSPSRNGSIVVSRVGDGIAIDVPVKFSGGAGPNGDIARLLSLDRKGVSGAFVASVRGQIILDDRFCPKIANASAQFRWTTPAAIEVVGKNCAGVGRGLELCLGPWNLEIGSLLTPTINSKINDQIADINSKIPCDPVRAELSKIWQRYSIPVAVDKAPAVFVNVDPKSLSIPGIIAEDSGVKLVGRLDADVSASVQKGLEGSAGELPKNEPIGNPPGRLALAVPIAADYATLESVVNDQLSQQITRQPLAVDTPAGKVTITPSHVEIYPSGKSLAVGVTFKAATPAGIFDARGTIWLKANMEASTDGRALQFSDIVLTRKIDNSLWSTASGILADQLPAVLKDKTRIDLGKDIDKAVKKAQTVLSDPAQTKGVNLQASNIVLKLGRISPTDKSLIVEGLLDADVEATLPALNF